MWAAALVVFVYLMVIIWAAGVLVRLGDHSKLLKGIATDIRAIRAAAEKNSPV